MTTSRSTRRGFLGQAAAFVSGPMLPWGINLGALAQASAAQAAADDYKALVCVFLQGGNDHANTLVTSDAPSHQLYAAARPSLAWPREALSPTVLTPSLPLPGGRQMALAPPLAPLKAMFDARRMAVLLNIGPLAQPTTKSQFMGKTAVLPPKLFSHNDQQSVWQSYQAEGGATTGWGGRIADMGLGRNRNGQPLLTCVNLAGQAVFGAGEAVGQYMVDPAGPPLLRASGGTLFGSDSCAQAFLSLVTTGDPRVHRMAKEHALIMARAIDVNTTLDRVLAQAAARLPSAFAPATLNAKGADAQAPLMQQLGMAARLMAARQALGVQRQVFFVSLGGFDHHDNLRQSHPALLKQVGDALAAFDAALLELGLSDKVTTFTASDFGRTMQSNGDGTDHGWGSHHFVMGGAVKGGRFYGVLPEVMGGEHDIGQGRLLPRMAVAQLAEALARWMGVTDSAQLDAIAPGRASFTDPQTSLQGLLAG